VGQNFVTTHNSEIGRRGGLKYLRKVIQCQATHIPLLFLPFVFLLLTTFFPLVLLLLLMLLSYFLTLLSSFHAEWLGAAESPMLTALAIIAVHLLGSRVLAGSTFVSIFTFISTFASPPSPLSFPLPLEHTK